jgi:cellulose synthase/poly-beta-1,6-N-acetylglucosamine synthase-like glycosyltransferase
MGSNLKLSILIPLRSITPQLQETINNLNIGNNYGRQFEIILSFDGTEQKQKLEVPINLREQVKSIYSKQQKGAAHARNAAARISKGEFLCFVDSDIILPVNFLDQWFEDNFDHETYYSATIYPIHSTSQISHVFNAVVLRKSTRYGITYIATATSWLNRDLFYKIGKFDEEFKDAAGEDAEFCIRAHKNQVQIQETRIIVYHDNPTTVEEFKSRAERYATKGNLYHRKLREFYGQSLRGQNSNVNLPSSRYLSRIFYKARTFLARNLQILGNQLLIVFKGILSALTMNLSSKTFRYVSRLRLGMKNAREAHDHHFVKFTLSKKVQFVFYAFLWSFTYRKHLKKGTETS